MKKPYVSAVIVAAGQGRRMKAGCNKQYLLLRGKPILAHTLDVFEKSNMVHEIIVVVGKDEKKLCQEKVIKAYQYKKVKKLVYGGKTRQESMYNGLLEVDKNSDIIITHDGARPLVENDIIKKSVEETLIYKAVIAGVPVKDTIKQINAEGFVENTPPRAQLWSVQTPQSFGYRLLLKAHNIAIEQGFNGTDDAMLVENIGHPIKMIKGKYDNIKITTPEDLLNAESIINARKEKTNIK